MILLPPGLRAQDLWRMTRIGVSSLGVPHGYIVVHKTAKCCWLAGRLPDQGGLQRLPPSLPLTSNTYCPAWGGQTRGVIVQTRPLKITVTLLWTDCCLPCCPGKPIMAGRGAARSCKREEVNRATELVLQVTLERYENINPLLSLFIVHTVQW